MSILTLLPKEKQDMKVDKDYTNQLFVGRIMCTADSMRYLIEREDRSHSRLHRIQSLLSIALSYHRENAPLVYLLAPSLELSPVAE